MPRFTLRTLLVVVALVAVALGWLAWQQRTVQRRSEFLEMLAGTDGGSYAVLAYPAGSTLVTYVWTRVWHQTQYVQTQYPNGVPKKTMTLGPGPYRRWLNDRTIAAIEIPRSMPNGAEAARTLFPEAVVRDLERSIP